MEKDSVPKPLQVYTKRFKDVVSTSLHVDPESTVTDSDPPHSTSLPTDPLLFTLEMDTSASYDLDFLIAHRKACTQHTISNYVS